jgi:hypothetical protein
VFPLAIIGAVALFEGGRQLYERFKQDQSYKREHWDRIYDDASDGDGIDGDAWREQRDRISQGVERARIIALDELNGTYKWGLINKSVGAVGGGTIRMKDRSPFDSIGDDQKAVETIFKGGRIIYGWSGGQ